MIIATPIVIEASAILKQPEKHIVLPSPKGYPTRKYTLQNREIKHIDHIPLRKPA
jgi:hypothetical protein